MSRVGEQIRTIRVEKGITPKELAKKCGVTEKFMLEVEQGRKILSESQIKQVEKVLGVDLQGNIPLETGEEVMTLPEEPTKKEKKPPAVPAAESWDLAVSNLIRRYPVVNNNTGETVGYRYFPVIDNRVEGINPDKVALFALADDSLSGFRLNKGDTVVVHLGQEVKVGSFLVVETGGKRLIRKVGSADEKTVLLIAHDRTMSTQSYARNELKIIGHCVKAILDL